MRAKCMAKESRASDSRSFEILRVQQRKGRWVGEAKHVTRRSAERRRRRPGCAAAAAAASV